MHYANLALVNTTPEEVILNFAINVVPPSPEREVSVDINSRIILSYASAKRLALTLGNIISRYEEANGVIPMPRPQQAPRRAGRTSERAAEGRSRGPRKGRS